MTRFFGISLLILVSFVSIGCGSSGNNCTNLIKVAVAAAPSQAVDQQEQALLTQECNKTMASVCTDAEFQVFIGAISSGKMPTSTSISLKCAQSAVQFVADYAKAKVGQFVGSN